MLCVIVSMCQASFTAQWLVLSTAPTSMTRRAEEEILSTSEHFAVRRVIKKMK